MEEKFNLLKVIVTNLIAVSAAIISFILALNIRSIVVGLYEYRMFIRGDIPWAASFINAASIIIVMISWLAYIFLTHNYFEKKCVFTKKKVFAAVLKIVLPVIVAYGASEMFILFYFG